MVPSQVLLVQLQPDPETRPLNRSSSRLPNLEFIILCPPGYQRYTVSHSQVLLDLFPRYVYPDVFLTVLTTANTVTPVPNTRGASSLFQYYPASAS